jgi:hypothetical protein
LTYTALDDRHKEETAMPKSDSKAAAAEEEVLMTLIDEENIVQQTYLEINASLHRVEEHGI